MTVRSLCLLAFMSAVVVFTFAGCSGDSVPATAPEVAEAPRIGEVTLSGDDGSN